MGARTSAARTVCSALPAGKGHLACRMERADDCFNLIFDGQVTQGTELTISKYLAYARPESYLESGAVARRSHKNATSLVIRSIPPKRVSNLLIRVHFVRPGFPVFRTGRSSQESATAGLMAPDPTSTALPGRSRRKWGRTSSG